MNFDESYRIKCLQCGTVLSHVDGSEAATFAESHDCDGPAEGRNAGGRSE